MQILKLFVITLCLVPLSFFGQKDQEIKDRCLKLTNDWMEKTLYLVKNTPGYTAPVAARTLCYQAVANYESMVKLIDGKSLSGQLNGLDLSDLKLPAKLSYEHACNSVNYLLAIHLFQNMSPTDNADLKSFYEANEKSYKKYYSKKELKASYGYAEDLKTSILTWSKEDGAAEAWNKNFPDTFEPEKCDGCWERTLPGYVKALQPYWGENRLMIVNNGAICDDIPFLPYTTEEGSDFYNEAKKIHDAYEDLSKEEIDIAKFWNDAPGVSGTPAGHMFAIALTLAKQENLDLAQTAGLYAMLGVSINDAVIESWRLKYKYNLIRPITYIHRNMTEKFTPALITPPFPEFPSGHSFQAGAGTEVLNHFFGKDFGFTDNTNVDRSDINGAARTYETFDAMGEEMSLSRFYGGIHYLNTLDVSLEYGRRIGRNTASTLVFE